MEQPNTVCVLMLLMRIGASAVVKLMKLIAAMAITRNATISSRRVCALSPCVCGVMSSESFV